MSDTLDELLSAADGVADRLEDAPAKRGPSQATLLVQLASDIGLWHAPDGKPYATAPVDGHHEHARLPRLRGRLHQRYYDAYKSAPGTSAVTDALAVLAGRAEAGPEHTPSVRVAQHDDTSYLDLGDPTWRAVAVDASGWRIVTDPPVYFIRAAGTQPLPTPTPGGALSLLRPFVHTATVADYRLIVAWLLAALRPTGPYPVLPLYGEQGSGKTTLSRMLLSLVDPAAAGLRTPPREVRDVAIAANNGHVVAYDNLSHLPDWLSDTICRLSTGAAFATRTLYADDDETLFCAMRPILINGIDEVATRDDLLDRSVPVTLPVLKQRLPEKALWAAWQRDRPRILGALLDIVAAGLRALPTMRLDDPPRMADFAVWTAATADACGWSADLVLADYAANRAGSRATALDAVSWLPAVRALDLPWSGTASELLAAMASKADEAQTRSRDWPKAARTVSATLRRLAPALRATGLDVSFARAGRQGTRTIALAEWRETSSASSASSAEARSPDAASARIADARLTQRRAADESKKVCVSDLASGADATDDADAPALYSTNGYVDANASPVDSSRSATGPEKKVRI